MIHNQFGKHLVCGSRVEEVPQNSLILKSALHFLHLAYFISSTWLMSSLLVTWHFCQLCLGLMSIMSCTIAMKLISRLSLQNNWVSKILRSKLFDSTFIYLIIFMYLKCTHTYDWCNILLCMIRIIIKTWWWRLEIYLIGLFCCLILFFKILLGIVALKV